MFELLHSTLCLAVGSAELRGMLDAADTERGSSIYRGELASFWSE
jgi:hypothetical protein